MSSDASILPLQLSGVGFRRNGEPLIDGIDFTFLAGRRTIILGPNGAGKSLLLRLCHGLIQPTDGRIRWQRPYNIARKRQAMVFQRPVMLRRTARANVDYALKLRGLPPERRRRRVDEALAATRLSHIAERPARVLSGGEQQRLALARAWALNPEVLFLDEPTANLDPAASRAVERIVEAFHDGGTKIIMTTHDLGQAKRLADEIIFLHHGRILEYAEADRFFDQPRTQEADAFTRGELFW